MIQAGGRLNEATLALGKAFQELAKATPRDPSTKYIQNLEDLCSRLVTRLHLVAHALRVTEHGIANRVSDAPTMAKRADELKSLFKQRLRYFEDNVLPLPQDFAEALEALETEGLAADL